MQISKIVKVMEDFAPLQLQESYDNAGMIVGNAEDDVNAVLLCIDVTESVLDEAAGKGCGLVVSHHPAIFGGVRKLTGDTLTGRIVIKAVRQNIALYASHTNIDNVWGGVNSRIGEKLGLEKTEILVPASGMLRKLVVFVPTGNAEKVREAMFNAGAGHIGEYDKCSFNIEGEGSFRGSENSDPYKGKAGSLHFEKEVRIETVFPAYLEGKVVQQMVDAHPYEEVAYDIYPLHNRWNRAGAGIIGDLRHPLEPVDFLKVLKEVFGTEMIRYSGNPGRKISRVALCGGSGGSFIGAARSSGADIYLSGDIKYHDFFEADSDFMIADIGHFESEQFTMEIFHDLLTKKFPNFAIHFSEVNTNPIHYF